MNSGFRMIFVINTTLSFFALVQSMSATYQVQLYSYLHSATLQHQSQLGVASLGTDC